MGMPPDYLMGVMHGIESQVVKNYKEFPKLTDKDIEWIYEKLMNYFKTLSSRKEEKEPLSTSDMKQAVIDEILNMLDARKEIQADDGYR